LIEGFPGIGDLPKSGEVTVNPEALAAFHKGVTRTSRLRIEPVHASNPTGLSGAFAPHQLLQYVYCWHCENRSFPNSKMLTSGRPIFNA
jgi:hypothetical protein